MKKRELVLKRIVQISPFAVMAVIIIAYLVYFRDLSVDDIVNFTPENLLAAFGLFMLMYALKSLSIFFPLAVLNIAAGTIFDIPFAILVNMCGAAVMSTVPFFIGRYSQREFVMSLVKKNKKAEDILSMNMENQVFFAYFLRVINCLPIDIVSMLLGSLGFSYKKYITGSLLGFAPIVIATTVLGNAVTEPGSPQFIISACIIVTVSVTSAVIYSRKIKKRKQDMIKKG